MDGFAQIEIPDLDGEDAFTLPSSSAQGFGSFAHPAPGGYGASSTTAGSSFPYSAQHGIPNNLSGPSKLPQTAFAQDGHARTFSSTSGAFQFKTDYATPQSLARTVPLTPSAAGGSVWMGQKPALMHQGSSSSLVNESAIAATPYPARKQSMHHRSRSQSTVQNTTPPVPVPNGYQQNASSSNLASLPMANATTSSSTGTSNSSTNGSGFMRPPHLHSHSSDMAISAASTSVSSPVSARSEKPLPTPASISSFADDHMAMPKSHKANTSSGVVSDKSLISSSHATSASQNEHIQPLELALYLLLDQFFERAESKISEALGRPIDQEFYLPTLLAAGVDAQFDSMLDAISHVSRRLPKLVVDVIMRWRKSQSEGIDTVSISRAIASAPNPTTARQVAEALNERKSLASIYILCRGLLAVIKATNREILGEELGSKLEEILFNSLKNANPYQVARSANRQANMDLYARLIGALSSFRFTSTADRFIADLAIIEKAAVPKDLEPRLEHIIRGMQYLRIELYPLELFEEAAEFMEGLAKIFDAASGSRLKLALTETMITLITPVANTATAEANTPQWTKAMQAIHTRALQMVAKPRYSSYAVALACTAVSASSQEVLLASWASTLELCLGKFKEKTMRSLALYGGLQLLWAYLRRCQESPSATVKRIEPFVKAVFPPGRKTISPSEAPLDIVAYIPFVVAYRAFDYGAELISSLLTVSNVTSQSGISWTERLSPERMISGIRAAMLLLYSLESNNLPALPAFSPDDHEQDATLINKQGQLAASTLDRPGLQAAVNGWAASIAAIARICQTGGDATVFDDANIVPRGAQPSANPPDREIIVFRRNGPFMVTYARDRQVQFALLASCFNSWPWLLDQPSVDFHPVDMLLQGLNHVDVGVNQAARQALERMVQTPFVSQILIRFSYVIGGPSYVLRDNAIYQPQSVIQVEGLVNLWLHLIRLSLTPSSDAPTEPILGPRRPAVVTQSKSSITFDEHLAPLIEGTALVLLCSQSPTLRRAALDALPLVAEIDSSYHSRNTEVLQIFSKAGHLIENVEDGHMSNSEKARLNKWRKHDQTELVTQIIQSESASDIAVWHLLIGPLFQAVSKTCPEATGIARRLLASRAARLQPAALTAAGLAAPRGPAAAPGVKSAIYGFGADVAYLVDTWRAHLAALCAITTDEVMLPIGSIPSEVLDILPSNNGERFSSGSEIIRQVMPFLASDNAFLRDAVARGLSSVHISLYKPLLDGLSSILRHLSDERRLRLEQVHSTKRSQRNTRLHATVARVIEVTLGLLTQVSQRDSEAILSSLSLYFFETLAWLRDPEAQDDVALHSMRNSFCLSVQRYCQTMGERLCIIQRPLPPSFCQEAFAAMRSWSFRSVSIDGFENNRFRSDRDTAARSRAGSSAAGSTSHITEVSVVPVNAMAMLCAYPGLTVADVARQGSEGIDCAETLRWLQRIFDNNDERAHRLARESLIALLKTNSDHKAFLEGIVYASFAEAETVPLATSFFAVVSQLGSDCFKSTTITCLAIWKLVSTDLGMRQSALRTLAPTLSQGEPALLQACNAALHTSTGSCGFAAQIKVVLYLAGALASEARAVFLEFAVRILQIDSKQGRSLLRLLPNWLANVEIPIPTDSSATDPVLANLFLLTAKFSEQHSEDLREMWQSVAKGVQARNLEAICAFLVEEIRRRGSKEFVRFAQKVASYLTSNSACAAMLSRFEHLIQPSALLLSSDAEANGTVPIQPTRRTNLDALFPVGARRLVLSPAQAAIFLVSDVLLGNTAEQHPCLPKLVHGLIMLVDHSTPFVRMQARDSIARLATSLAMSQLLYEVDGAGSTKSQQTAASDGIDWLWKTFWDHDDRSLGSDVVRCPRHMQTLVRDLIRLFSAARPNFEQNLGEVALEWAVTCPIRHVACRSFQVFRCVLPVVQPSMITGIVARLSNTVSDQTPDARLFAAEIIDTLTAAARARSPATLQLLPHIFWTSAICLGTASEQEFLGVLNLMQAIVAVIDDEGLASTFAGCQAQFGGLIAFDSFIGDILLKGLRSRETHDASWCLVETLSSSTISSLVLGTTRSIALLYGASLAASLRSVEDKVVSPQIETIAGKIALLAGQQDRPGIVRVMTSVAKGRFRAKDDFVRQAIANVKEYFSPELRLDVFVLMLGTLYNPQRWLQEKTLVLLKPLVRLIEPSETDIQCLGPDLLSPLLHLLSGDLTLQVLQVLEEPVAFVSQALERSMQPLRQANAQTRRGPDGEELPNPPPVFGDPLQTGWCLPDPETAQESTRSQLRDIIEMLPSQDGPAAPASPLKFANDEFSGQPEGQHMDARTQSDVGDASTLGDMVSQLHQLGNFFDEDTAGSPAAYRLSTMLGSASRVASVLSRSQRSARPEYGSAFAEGGYTNGTRQSFDSTHEPFHDGPHSIDSDAEAHESSDLLLEMDSAMGRRQRRPHSFFRGRRT
ncbi:uncharacterized protein L969DRAFT_91404 [Mixia osmundae IAM 14324]|uniref:Cell morphogenesis protein N-terminal domain-containing protein n=1 Tax=Mixia osmundae (strain CBS 9802 / IAM 14324 / JCM 22182 / KY 12970) TaxID=764103 RepID=G7E3S9_MIXOS|nr:uncharacterized protein L969DRAFT_91404 [Mixia osmundae IAM 14324]KEI41934.1 hypothetical protein L969DRAFT_91404 [Mixia osmundae IAM 14324]GAA97489.1 hypothetical protein E5Q_04167 [Mixia osmundae IAM 14324]